MITENVSQKPIWRAWAFRYAPLILWICLVLSASSGQASMSQTSRFVGPLLHFLFPNASEETVYLYHHYIRKLAHLTEYGILALWAARAFLLSPGKFFQKYWFFLSLGVVALVASTDEFHQSFVASREGSIYDVLLDVTGGFVFLAVVLIYKRFRN